MKKTITIIAGILLTAFTTKAQFNMADFESLVLPTDSFYTDTTGTDFISSNTIFQYDWTQSQWGDYWGGGFVYSNKTDSVTSGYGNMYSAKAAGGYNLSSNYVISMNNSIIKFSNPSGTAATGFYVTNSTFAYNSMRDGDMFAKKFGGVSGNDPDWFKLTVHSYHLGVLTNDSVEFYLADFRFSNNSQDYMVKTWQYVDLTSMSLADSFRFDLSSSDVGSFGMNTPAYFCMDNFASQSIIIGLKDKQSKAVSLYPNPASHFINLQLNATLAEDANYQITDITGKIILSDVLNSSDKPTCINVEELNSGIYFIRLINEAEVITKKFTKQ